MKVHQADVNEVNRVLMTQTCAVRFAFCPVFTKH